MNAQIEDYEGLDRDDLRQLRRLFRLGMALLGALVVTVGVIAWLVEVDITVPAAGQLEAKGRIEVEAPLEGIISEVLISEADRVEVGQLLIRMDDTQLRSALRTAQLAHESARGRKMQLEAEISSMDEQIESRIATAEANVASLKLENPGKIQVQEAWLQKSAIRVTQTEADYLKAKTLFDQGVVSGQKMNEAKKELELAEADRKVAELELKAVRSSASANLSKAQAELTESRADRLNLEIKRKELALVEFEIERTDNEMKHLKEQQDRLEVRAPASGEILTRRPDRLVGRYFDPGDALLEIGDAHELVVDARLDEEFLPKVAPGMPAKIYLPALPYREYRVFEGTLSKIGATFDRADERSGGASGDSEPSSAKTPIEITLEDTRVIHEGQEIRLKPGLTAEIEIVVKSIGVFELAWEEVQKIRSRRSAL